MKFGAKTLGAVALAVGATGLPAPANATVTFYQAFISMTNLSAAQGANGTQDSLSQKFVSATSLPVSDLVAKAKADSKVEDDDVLQARGLASDIATLHFAGANAGSLVYSSSTLATVLAHGFSAEAQTYGYTMDYYFYVDVDSVFSYSLATGSTQNSPSTVFRLMGEFGDILHDQNYGENVSTSGTILLPASPLLYYIDFFRAPGASDVSQTGLGTKSATATNAFSFSIAPVTPAVPEPATWAMLIGGFGLTGATMRSRAHRTAPAA